MNQLKMECLVIQCHVLIIVEHIEQLGSKNEPIDNTQATTHHLILRCTKQYIFMYDSMIVNDKKICSRSCPINCYKFALIRPS